MVQHHWSEHCRMQSYCFLIKLPVRLLAFFVKMYFTIGAEKLFLFCFSSAPQEYLLPFLFKGPAWNWLPLSNLQPMGSHPASTPCTHLLMFLESLGPLPSFGFHFLPLLLGWSKQWGLRIPHSPHVKGDHLFHVAYVTYDLNSSTLCLKIANTWLSPVSTSIPLYGQGRCVEVNVRLVFVVFFLLS